MKTERAFVLLEMSCFGFLFLCSILPFLSFQKDVYRFIQKDKETLQKEASFQNMRALLLQNILEFSEEATLYYSKKIGWQREKIDENYQAKIKKSSLLEREASENIWYFQIYEEKKGDLVWEGFRFVEK